LRWQLRDGGGIDGRRIIDRRDEITYGG